MEISPEKLKTLVQSTAQLLITHETSLINIGEAGVLLRGVGIDDCAAASVLAELRVTWPDDPMDEDDGEEYEDDDDEDDDQCGE